MKTKYVEPKAYMNPAMKKAFNEAKKSDQKPAKGKK